LADSFISVTALYLDESKISGMVSSVAISFLCVKEEGATSEDDDGDCSPGAAGASFSLCF
jgi:hypothetical protein